MESYTNEDFPVGVLRLEGEKGIDELVGDYQLLLYGLSKYSSDKDRRASSASRSSNASNGSSGSSGSIEEKELQSSPNGRPPLIRTTSSTLLSGEATPPSLKRTKSVTPSGELRYSHSPIPLIKRVSSTDISGGFAGDPPFLSRKSSKTKLSSSINREVSQDKVEKWEKVLKIFEILAEIDIKVGQSNDGKGCTLDVKAELTELHFWIKNNFTKEDYNTIDRLIQKNNNNYEKRREVQKFRILKKLVDHVSKVAYTPELLRYVSYTLFALSASKENKKEDETYKSIDDIKPKKSKNKFPKLFNRSNKTQEEKEKHQYISFKKKIHLLAEVINEIKAKKETFKDNEKGECQLCQKAIRYAINIIKDKHFKIQDQVDKDAIYHILSSSMLQLAELLDRSGALKSELDKQNRNYALTKDVFSRIDFKKLDMSGKDPEMFGKDIKIQEKEIIMGSFNSLKGCDLCLMPELPKDMEGYLNKYILVETKIEKKLYFIKPGTEGNVLKEEVSITDFKKFSDKLAVIRGNDMGNIIHLTHQQHMELITLNGDHINDPRFRVKPIPGGNFNLYAVNESIIIRAQEMENTSLDKANSPVHLRMCFETFLPSIITKQFSLKQGKRNGGTDNNVFRNYEASEYIDGVNLKNHIYQLHDKITKGCDLYIMSKMPENVEEYENNYILIGSQLYYIKPDENEKVSKEKVSINDFKRFSNQLVDIKIKGNNTSDLIHLSHNQVNELIISNGGHAPTEKVILVNLIELQLIIISSLKQMIEFLIDANQVDVVFPDFKTENFLIEVEKVGLDDGKLEGEIKDGSIKKDGTIKLSDIKTFIDVSELNHDNPIYNGNIQTTPQYCTIAASRKGVTNINTLIYETLLLTSYHMITNETSTSDNLTEKTQYNQLKTLFDDENNLIFKGKYGEILYNVFKALYNILMSDKKDKKEDKKVVDALKEVLKVINTKELNESVKLLFNNRKGFRKRYISAEPQKEAHRSKDALQLANEGKDGKEEAPRDEVRRLAP